MSANCAISSASEVVRLRFFAAADIEHLTQALVRLSFRVSLGMTLPFLSTVTSSISLRNSGGTSLISFTRCLRTVSVLPS
jgi:hypothetical protein